MWNGKYNLVLLSSLFLLQACASVDSGRQSRANDEPPATGLEGMMAKLYNVPSIAQDGEGKTQSLTMSKLYCQPNMGFELYQGKQEHDNAQVQVTVTLPFSIANRTEGAEIIDGASLHVFINGEEKTLNALPVDESDKQGKRLVHRRYLMPLSMVDEIGYASSFYAQLDLKDDEQIQANCGPLSFQQAKENWHYDKPITPSVVNFANRYVASEGFKQFLAMVDNANF